MNEDAYVELRGCGECFLLVQGVSVLVLNRTQAAELRNLLNITLYPALECAPALEGSSEKL